jgi:hypothetical protein
MADVLQLWSLLRMQNLTYLKPLWTRTLSLFNSKEVLPWHFSLRTSPETIMVAHKTDNVVAKGFFSDKFRQISKDCAEDKAAYVRRREYLHMRTNALIVTSQ